jgi:predicted permease
MALIGEWARRLGYLLRRGAAQDELRREMEAHRAMMDDPRAFGNMLRLREESRQAWGWRWLEDLWLDTRFAWRTLRHSPGFSLTAVITLALGIGVNTAMFTLVDGLLLAPLYENADNVVGVSSRSTAPDGGRRGLSYPNYVDLREGTASVFSDLAAASTDVGGVDFGDGARRVLASRATANYFRLFGTPLALGRAFTAEEEADAAEVAVIGFSLWQQRGGDPGILGRTIHVDGEAHTIVGVAAEGFTGDGVPGAEVWTPLDDRRRDVHYLSVVGRIRDGVSIDAVAPALATVGQRLARAYPEANRGFTFEMVQPARLPFMPGAGSGAMTAISGLLMLMPAIVLLVASLNLADLLLARGHIRRQELAIRSSLGGGRGRLMRQLLAEGMLLSLAGAAAGLLFSKWTTGMLLTSLRPVLPAAVSLPAFDLDGRVLTATLVFSLLAVLVFGAWPAWKATGRRGALDLKQRGGDDGARSGGLRLGRALVTVQVALSLLLLASGGLFVMSVRSTASVDPGFRLAGGLVVEIDGDLAGYDEEESRTSQLAIVDRLRSVPGVDAVTIASGFPFSGFNDSRRVAPAGATDRQGAGVDAVFFSAGRDHARVFGLPLLAGRDFTDGEVRTAGAEPVAIVNDTLAERLWPGEGALDRQIQFVDDDGTRDGPPRRIVGIVKGSKHSLENPQPYSQVFVPLGQHDETGMMLQLRIADAAAEQAMLTAVTGEIRTVDPRMPILRGETWRDHVYESVTVWLYRAGARVFTAFGVMALLLAVVGVYGVKSYLVARRTREFGIRLATGAQPRTLLWQVLWEGGRVTGIGIAIGLVLAVGAGQFLQGLLYGIRSVEPLVLVTAPLILLAASLLAALFPALRATRVDPTVALRAE